MRELWPALVKFLVSLRLTVALLALSVVLIFVATLAQTRLGVLGVHDTYFHAWIVLERFNGVPVPVFPGGYSIGGLLFINLVAAHLKRFKLTWRKLGIHLTHAGVVLLLLGELLSGIWQQDFQLKLNEGDTKNYAESSRNFELALINTSDSQSDDVVAIPTDFLARGEPLTLSNSEGVALPFRVIPRAYYPNADWAGPSALELSGTSLATTGLGPKLSLTPQPTTTQDDKENMQFVSVELVTPAGQSLGKWLVSPLFDEVFPRKALDDLTAGMLGMHATGLGWEFPPQTFTDPAGHTWRLTLRQARSYQPYSLTLIKAAHDNYPGTNLDKNFSSRVRLQSADGLVDRETLIHMNAPLRYSGLTFYQQQMDTPEYKSVLEVVSNPSWKLPYISCLMVAAGLVFQFGLSLVNFLTRRVTTAATKASAG